MKYYINSNRQPITSGGNYEIHKETCYYYYHYKSGNNFIYLGDFNSDISALSEAKRRFPSHTSEIDGCAYCCPSINKYRR